MPQSQIVVGEHAALSERGRPLPTGDGMAFEPRHAMRCAGDMRFRSQPARDLACLLDLDPDVGEWSCLPPPLRSDGLTFVVDLRVRRTSVTELVSVATRSEDFSAPAWAVQAAEVAGAVLHVVPAAEVEGDRLENCRELLRYARWRVTLSDRIRLLAALDEEGSMTLFECMSAIRNVNRRGIRPLFLG